MIAGSEDVPNVSRRSVLSALRGGRAFRRQKLLQHALEFGDPDGRYVPDFIEIDTEVVVDQDVPHPTDRLPIEGRHAVSRLSRNALGRLADHLDVADDRILQLLGRQERRSSGANEARDAVTAFQHVVEVEPIVLHKGVASRRILSRTYQWRDFSVPT